MMLMMTMTVIQQQAGAREKAKRVLLDGLYLGTPLQATRSRTHLVRVLAALTSLTQTSFQKANVEIASLFKIVTAHLQISRLRKGIKRC